MERLRYPEKFMGGESLQTSFYLAGGCATEWRQYLMDRMTSDEFYNAVIIDPVSSTYDPKKNTEWEFNTMRRSDCIVFWFAAETLQPISLFELGTVCRDHLKPMIVGIHPQYEKVDTLITQLKLFRPDVRIVFDLNHVLSEMEQFVEVNSGVSYDTDYIQSTGECSKHLDDVGKLGPRC